VLRLGRHLQHPAARSRRQIAARKVANIASVKPDIVAAGNIGCMVQIAGGISATSAGKATPIPVVHTVELVDWATGGPTPSAMSSAKHLAVA
jgi:glycolate oxidase iron-sulfur subunit